MSRRLSVVCLVWIVASSGAWAGPSLARAEEPEAAAEPEMQVEPAQAEPAAAAEPAQAEPAQAEPAQAEPAAAAPEPTATDGEALDEAAQAAGLAMDPDALRALLERARATAIEKIAAKLEAKQAAQMDRVSTWLGLFSLAGVLLLLTPLALRRRYPGQGALLFKYGALAALTFFVSVNLFAVSLTLVRSVQGALGAITNPQIAIVDGAIDTLSDNAQEIAGIGKIVEPALTSMESGAEASPAVAIALTLGQNLAALGKDVSALKGLAGFFKQLSGLLGGLPVVLSLLAVVIFVLAFRPTIMAIVSMPAAVAEGRATGRQVIGQVLRTVGREFLVTLAFIVVLVLVTTFSGVMLGQVVRPAVQALLGFVLAGFAYLMTTPSPSSGLLLFCLAAVGVFLALNVAVVLASTAFYLGKAHKILRARFHDRVPLRAHRRFFGLGTLALVWAQALPLLFIALGEKLVDAVFDRWGGDGQLLTALVLSALVLTVGFVLVFWAARGLRAVLLLQRYPVPPAGLSPASPASSPGPATSSAPAAA